MTTIALKSAWPTLKNTLQLILTFALPFVLVYLGRELQELVPTMGVLDASIWQLIIVSALSFLGLNSLSWWVLQRAWANLGLPKIEQMVLQFNQLTLWQQFVFYWVSFALLLLAAVLSLLAVF